MSLILKGIDLPKEGSLVIAIQKYGNIYIQQKSEDGRNIFVDQKDYHQAIQIPKGARLIDANALFKDLKEQQIPFNSDINSAINVAPTILESEVMPDE